MAISPESIPRFDAAEALAAALEHYGIQGSAAALPSERDQNFLLIDPVRGKFVLKIANREDSAELLDFQHQAMRRVAGAGSGIRVAEVVRSRAGAELETILGRDGNRHYLRVFSWIEGMLLAERTPRSRALLESLGAAMAQVDVALAGFVHPAMHRVLQWDLRHAGLARTLAPLLPERWRERVQAAFARWDEVDWKSLRHGVIHGDANDHNVLVEGDRVSGLLDFGDLVHSAIVCELAVALAYAMLSERQPLDAASAVIRGYQRHNSLGAAEQRALYPLVHARLAASLCYSAYNKARDPHDPYQVVSEAGVRQLLERLEAHSFEAAQQRLLEACRS